MSIFSDKLYKILTDNDINIRQLAQTTGIERTTLHKVISGSRTIKREQLESLLSALALTPSEKKEITHAYEVSKNGEEKFYRRQKVKDIIGSIAKLSEVKFSDSPGVNSAGLPYQSNKETESFSGKFAVNNAIASVVYSENEMLNFSMPPDCLFFYETLFAKYTVSKTLSIRSFISFCKVKNNDLVNLDILESIMPFLMAPKNKFQAYYIYSDSSAKDALMIPFPYYIHTQTYTLLLSGELDHAVMTKNRDITDCYGKTCQHCLESSAPLLKRIESVEELISYYSNNLIANQLALNAIESQPCLSIYLDFKTLHKYRTNDSEELSCAFRDFSAYTGQIKKMSSSLPHIFTNKGLSLFVETGVISILPPDYVKPIDIDDRIRLIQYMLDDLINDKVNFRLIDSTKFVIPENMSIVSGNNGSLLISSFEYCMGGVNALYIEAQSIVYAFQDFFISVPDSDLLFSKDDTVQAVQNALRRLEDMK